MIKLSNRLTPVMLLVQIRTYDNRLVWEGELSSCFEGSFATFSTQTKNVSSPGLKCTESPEDFQLMRSVSPHHETAFETIAEVQLGLKREKISNKRELLEFQNGEKGKER